MTTSDPDPGPDPDVDLDAIEASYTPQPIPPCCVCGAELAVASAGGGRATKYACPAVYANGVDAVGSQAGLAQKEHYARSQFHHTRPGDERVVALVARVRALESMPAAARTAQFTAGAGVNDVVVQHQP